MGYNDGQTKKRRVPREAICTEEKGTTWEADIQEKAEVRKETQAGETINIGNRSKTRSNKRGEGCETEGTERKANTTTESHV